jgi:hypothetical protein
MNLEFFLHPWCYIKIPTDMLIKQSLLKGTSVADEKPKLITAVFMAGIYIKKMAFVLL